MLQKKNKMKRRSLVSFNSDPRVARSYFLYDSISAAGTFTQDSFLLLPFIIKDVLFAKKKIKEEKENTFDGPGSLMAAPF